MMQWGIFGLGAASAGLYLANNFLILGKYFGDSAGSNWPHIPLHKEPTLLENEFNQLLENTSYIMSNETLKNVSILDLPAFGTAIGTLRKHLKKQYDWPIETNFAVRRANPDVNYKDIFMSYKTLVEDWAEYMEHEDKKDSTEYFTMEMKNNKHLNFTKFIKADMKTYLLTVAGKTIIFLPKIRSRKKIKAPQVNKYYGKEDTIKIRDEFLFFLFASFPQFLFTYSYFFI